MENAVESPLFPAGKRAAAARLPLAQQFGRNVVAALSPGHRLRPADNVGLADRVLNRHRAVVRPVPAHQPAALHHPNRATAAHQVREGDRGGK